MLVFVYIYIGNIKYIINIEPEIQGKVHFFGGKTKCRSYVIRFIKHTLK